ncbi:bidirectional sugar transporter SWEET12-like isoform X1 [Zingiber officinale]|uniref:bidirectional sugar transporter SWEET12-like isoform X1 n=2 Tax=Zingiber officinale TaxID=94328 RepID=UPI001C4C271F|nr:bidirectional sugar transporter SWEET12-like isoform X1 [Zingiber officinale]
MLVITIENPALTAAGLLGNFLSAMVVLAPVSTFYRICKKKSTESFQSVPYVVGLFSATMWVYYGLLTSDVLLLTINIAVCFIEVIYLFIFLLYAPPKSRIYTTKLIALINVGVFGCLILVSNLFIKESKRARITGGICASFAVSVFGAPLSIIRHVIRTKSVEYMPFSLSFFLTLSAIAWLSYGVLLKDPFVAVPNVFGFLLGITQIIVYLIYMNYNKKDDIDAKIGSQELTEKKSNPEGEACECGQMAEV